MLQVYSGFALGQVCVDLLDSVAAVLASFDPKLAGDDDPAPPLARTEDLLVHPFGEVGVSGEFSADHDGGLLRLGTGIEPDRDGSLRVVVLIVVGQVEPGADAGCEESRGIEGKLLLVP